MTDFIDSHDLFKGVPAEEVESLMTCSRENDYTGKHLLYIPGDDLNQVFLVKTGEVSLYYIHDGKRVIVDVMGEGDLFGNFSPDITKTVHFAEASAGTRLCHIASADFLELIRKYPESLLKTITMLSQRILAYEHKLALCPAPAKQKILFEIERYTTRAGHAVQLTHQKIAQMTGLNRVTVTRGIQELVQDGKIDIGEEGIAVV